MNLLIQSCLAHSFVFTLHADFALLLMHIISKVKKGRYL